MNKYVRPLFSKQQKTLGELNAHTEQMVTGYKTIVAYNHQDEAILEFNEKSDLFAKQGMLAQICAGSMGPCMNFISNLSYFIVCICGALFIALNIGGPIYDFNGLDVATVIMFLTLTKQFTRPINQIAQLYTGLLNALAGAERVFNILDEEVEDFSGKVKIDMENIEGKIDFSHVKFGYVEEKTVLSDFSVSVRSGHKIALVGATGSGKTTIVNLLLRFYDINSGSIKIDGVDIFDISKEDLRNLLKGINTKPELDGWRAYVNKNSNTELFDGTKIMRVAGDILKNKGSIKLGNNLSSDDSIRILQDWPISISGGSGKYFYTLKSCYRFGKKHVGKCMNHRTRCGNPDIKIRDSRYTFAKAESGKSWRFLTSLPIQNKYGVKEGVTKKFSTATFKGTTIKIDDTLPAPPSINFIPLIKI
jgi:energy-coupling factor transporter ATP-binding protein EcfA2